MRVNVYAEEITDLVEICEKTTADGSFTGVRFYLHLPVTKWIDPADPKRGFVHHQGPFIHTPGDDDSSAVTFWGKQDLRLVLRKALDLLDKHYSSK